MALIHIPIGSRIYLDANVFIYAAEVPTAFPALMALLRQVDRGAYVAVTSALTLAEVLVAPLRAGNIPLELAYRSQIVSGPSLTVVDISRDILIRAATIRATTPTIKLPDAIHAASCEASACITFLTNDMRLKAISGLSIMSLTDLA